MTMWTVKGLRVGKIEKPGGHLMYHDSDGWWIELKYGWKNGDDPVGICHGIHEDTRREALAVLKYIVRCDCKECQKGDTE